MKSPVVKASEFRKVEVKQYMNKAVIYKSTENNTIQSHKKRARSTSSQELSPSKRSKNDYQSISSQSIKLGKINSNNGNDVNSNVNKIISSTVVKSSLSNVGKNSVSSSKSSISSVSKSSNSTSSVNSDSKSKLCCDRCDGKHETKDCPYYRKARDKHPDAQRRTKINGHISTLPGTWLKSMNIKIYRQPGDGSCLFHSMSHGLNDGSTASSLRKEICKYIISNPNIKICDTPLKNWIRWDTNSNIVEYVKKMYRGSWGGGIEMACVSNIKKVNIHVYQYCPKGYKRISAFDYPIEPEKRKIVRVLYQGRCHYDALKIL